MKINNFTDPSEITKELSIRFKAYRLSLNLTQTYISLKSGVALRTIKNFERDGLISLNSLIKILKVMNIAYNFDNLIPEIGLNTVDLHNLGHQKQRVSRTKNKTQIKWGDE